MRLMKMRFINKQKRVAGQITEYTQTIERCMGILHDSIERYCRDGDRETLRRDFQEIHRFEGSADDIRRDIELMMYTKALFPESRGDILGLLETMDRVPNHSESTVRMILNQHIRIPGELTADILRLVEITCKCVRQMTEAVAALFDHYMSAPVLVGKIDELETESDQAEEALIDRIFSSGMEGTEKILLRDLVRRIAGVSDRAENVGDRIRIMVAKRSI